MQYSDVVNALANLLEIPPADVDFSAILPRCIDYAEQRLYRELNLDASSLRLMTSVPSAGNRNIVIPIGTFVVLEGVNVITPVSATSPETGMRNRLVRLSWDALDMLYGSSALTGVPTYYALQDAASIALGPWPDQTYPVELVGTVRSTPLSSSNTLTTLTLYFPDLFLAACMIFLSGYTRNFGSQADDPRMAQSWENQYQTLLKSAIIEEARKKGIPVPGDV